MPPYPEQTVYEGVYPYPLQAERPLAERVHRGAKVGVPLGGRPSTVSAINHHHRHYHSLHKHSSRRGERGTNVATTTTRTTTKMKTKTKHRGGGSGGGESERSAWYAVIGGGPGDNIGGTVVSS